MELTSLKEETILNIISYLELIDLKLLSHTCKYLNELSWTRLEKVSKIHFKTILTHFDISVFKNSTKTYKSIQLPVYDLKLLKIILNQVENIPSVSLESIFLNFDEEEEEEEHSKLVAQILQPFEAKIQNVSINVAVSSPESALRIRSYYPKSKVTFKIMISSALETVDFNELNNTFKPKEITFLSDFPEINLDPQMNNIRKIILYSNPQCDLRHFRKLSSFHLQITKKLSENEESEIRTLIENNRASLTDFRFYKFNNIEGDLDFELPCQLKQFYCYLLYSQRSEMSTKMLRHKRNLRKMSLLKNKLTDEILGTLRNNQFLSSVNLKHCTIGSSQDMENYTFFKNNLEISYCEDFLLDLTILNAILEYSEKIIMLNLKIEKFSAKLCTIPSIRRKVFKNLRTINIFGTDVSKYVSKIIEAPFLEVCRIDCSPSFLQECRQLRKLEIHIKLNCEEIKSILRNFKNLETFHFQMKLDYFDELFIFILENINTIKHFELDVYGDAAFDFSNIIDRNLEAAGLSWTKLETLYQTERFSFEIFYNCLG